MKHFQSWTSLILISILFLSHNLNAMVIFDGYYRIVSAGKHVGFSIVRYEYDPQKKQFTATTFLKTNELGGNITESVKAICAEEKFRPISYSYTSLEGTKSKVIDATFSLDDFGKGKNDSKTKTASNPNPKSKEQRSASEKFLVMKANIKENGKSVTKTDKFPSSIFLSVFLGHRIFGNEKGVKVGDSLKFEAIAEEDAQAQEGYYSVEQGEALPWDPQSKSFKISFDFKKALFISQVSERNEVISTRSPALALSTELVAQPSMATEGMQIPSGVVRELFGEVPTGQNNDVAKNYQIQKAKENAPPVEPSKQNGLPPGSNLMMKQDGK